MNASEREGLLREGERLDDLQRCGYHLIQHPDEFCFGIDAVLLSAYAEVKKNESAMDLCCGTGAVMMLLAAKTDGGHFTGLEIQERSADRAKRSILWNDQADRMRVVCGDLREAEHIFAPASFHVVTCNPPYLKGDGGIHAESESRTAARHEVLCTFEDVARAASYLLAPGGRLYLVHRPFRLADVICDLRRFDLEPKRMRLVEPFAGKEPNLVLFACVKGGRPHLTVDAPLIIYEKEGVYTREVLDLYTEYSGTADVPAR